MTRILRIGNWTSRRGATLPNAEVRTFGIPLEVRTSDPRPEMGRGRLTSFRRFRAVDADELLLWGKHSDAMLESYNLPLQTRDDARRWFMARQSWADSQLYAVDSLAERRVIGYIGLRQIDMVDRSSVLGISFDPGTLGRGHGTDSLIAFLAYYFESWCYTAMYLDVAACNVRARRCYEKCGYRYAGQRWKSFIGDTRRAQRSPVVQQNPELFRLGGLHPCVLYYDMSLTRAGWLAHRAER